MNKQRCSGIETPPCVQSKPRNPAVENGVIFYHGPSRFDQKRIVAIATGTGRFSRNEKTGPMLQTWILNPTQPPGEAAKEGEDYRVCGDCSLRGNGVQRGCYVALHRGPLQVWKGYRRGNYETVDRVSWGWAVDKMIRFGAYGDPAALPAEIWFKLAALSQSWTGYTHHWRLPKQQVLRWLLMASVDSPQEAWEARKKGWRTYRIRLPEEELLPFESVSPATKEGGSRTDCFRCGQCNGAKAVEVRRDYAVIAHGLGRKHYQRLRVL